MAESDNIPDIVVTGPPGEQVDLTPVIAPVRGKARIDVLDVLRGFAILAILYMNLPDMAGPTWASFNDPRTMGWSEADQHAWVFMHTFLSGTQRGLLEMLFGAGMLVMFRKAMEPDGPVGVADVYVRRNLWLLFFGMVDVYLLLWYGDIIHGYALCGLAIYPFRRLKPRTLLLLGLALGTLNFVGGGVQYIQRTSQAHAVEQIEAAQSAGKAISADDEKQLTEWRDKLGKIGTPDPEDAKAIANEAEARNGGMWDWMTWNWSVYSRLIANGLLLSTVLEATFTMFIGMALFKWGVLQGERSTGFYWKLLVLAYGFGLTVRYIGAHQLMLWDLTPKIEWSLQEYARLAVTAGHIALFNLLVRLPATRVALSPLKASGQLAFTIYFMQQIAGLYIMYSPIGLDMAPAPGWAMVLVYATVVNAALLVFANVWVRQVGMGPMEWLLRSLAYWKRQPWKAPA